MEMAQGFYWYSHAKSWTRYVISKCDGHVNVIVGEPGIGKSR